MPTVQKLSPEMVEAFLASIGWRYLRDKDSNFEVQFSYQEDIECALRFSLLLQGRNRDIYYLRMRSDKYVKRSDWPRYMYLVNRWNSERRWPKAYLEIQDPATSQRGEIILEQQMDLEQGIHQELLDDYTNTIFFGCYEFWKWITEEEKNSSGAGSE